MARTKNATPLKREPSSEYTQKNGTALNGTPRKLEKETNGTSVTAEALKSLVPEEARKGSGVLPFLIAVGGIYGSL